MPTTIQIHRETLGLLRKIKEETHSFSYDEAIRKIAARRAKVRSLGGYLGARPSRQLLRDLRDKRERF